MDIVEEKSSLHSDHVRVTVLKSRISPRRSQKEGPDKGWAWAVAFASCLISFIMAGLSRMSGILFVAFLEYFGVDRKSASMPFSIRSSTVNLLGPIVGILGQKYGARIVIVTGGIVGTVSSAACFFISDILWITVLWGGINGLGAALIVTLPQVVVGQYFDVYRTTATGIAFSGGCIGSFLFPVLLEYLLQLYGIGGTFLIIGAIIMNTIPAALILRKPSWIKEEEIDGIYPEECLNLIKEKDNSQDKHIKGNEYLIPEEKLKDQNMKLNYSFVHSVDESTQRIKKIYPDIKVLQDNSDLLVRILNISSPLEINQNDICDTVINMCCSLRDTSVLNTREVKDNLINNANQYSDISLPCLEEKSIISNSTDEELKLFILQKLSYLEKLDRKKIASKFPKEKKQTLLVLKELHKLKILCSMESEKHDKLITEIDNRGSNSFLELIKTALKLYVNPLFLMICLCRTVHFITFFSMMMIVVDFIMDKNLPENDGKFAIAAISAGDLLGRACFGWITDRGFMTLPKYMMVFMILQGISTVSLPAMRTKLTIFSNLAIFGMLQGSLFVRLPVLVSKYMRTHEQSIAMGCMNFFSGLIGLGLPIYIGYFRDTVGSYDYIFFVNGMIGICVALFWSFEPLFVKSVNTKRSTQKIAV